MDIDKKIRDGVIKSLPEAKQINDRELREKVYDAWAASLTTSGYTKIEDKSLVTLSGKGTLVSYTIGHVELDGQGDFADLKEPAIIGAIELEDADSTIFMPVEGIDPEDLAEGLKVELQWRKETKGELGDIRCFKPA